MRILTLTCILFLTSCGQVTSNSRIEIEQDKITIFNEKKGNLLLMGLNLSDAQWGGLSFDKGEAIPQDAEWEFDPITRRFKLRTEK